MLFYLFPRLLMHWEAPHLKEAGLEARAPPPAHAHSLRPRPSSQQPEGRVTTPALGQPPGHRGRGPFARRSGDKRGCSWAAGRCEGRPRAFCRQGRPFLSCPGYSSSLFGFQPRFLREAFPGAPASVSAFPRRALRLSFPARCLLRN